MINLSRRRVVLGTASVLAAGFGSQLLGSSVFTNLALAAPPLASAITMPDNFMQLSKKLTAMDNLESHLGQALYSWLHHAELDAQLDALTTLLDAHSDVIGDPLHQLLAQQPAALGQLYQQLVNGWYLGVVGQPGTQVCIGFENIVSYELVKDSLLPPSYAVGEPNFWIHKPESEVATHG
ncbi:sugar dehydrogenase complex small subunit [Serratia sp. M24T3]|uniref:Sugar dehydrogenase complex small subunit n=1 Tax=Rouxiella sp. WC2420 TaxID=3234145 RepID=A0AB39VWN7_9GAMM|nr:sugar dehydrogenase complex small subunit [Serratia sp. M24T3]EIC85007.1 gluconate dehydrogenase subunit [Serratia sp. M24T3]